MTSRERVLAAIERRPKDHVPCDLWAEPEVFASLRGYLGVEEDEDVRRALKIDMRWLNPDYIGPELRTHPDGSVEDVLGIRHSKVNYGEGEYEEISHHPLAGLETVAELNAYPWPNPDCWDYDGINAKIAEADAFGETWIGIGSGSYFERAWNMRGMANFLMDLAANPEFACCIMDRLGEFYLEHTERILDAADGRVDMVYTADDIGAQNGLMISLDMWRRYIMPRQAAFNDRLKRKYGVKIFYHSCGAISSLVPYLIDIGVDILNPLQFSAAGMDPVELKRKYGDRLTFHGGGVDVQTTMAHGTVEDVRAEVSERLRVLGDGGGYILAPSHSVQVESGVEKTLAIYEVGQGRTL